MSLRFRMLGDQNPSTNPPPDSPNVGNDDDFIVILAALLCALICILGLVAVARCSWFRRISDIVIISRTDHSPPTSANKGLKKKVLNNLPKLTYSTETTTVKPSDCAICLSEFNSGEEIRVLPQCGHSFHVTCVDTWFGSHSSCPSCRQILAPAPRCKKCGELPVTEPAGAIGCHTSGSTDRFLP